MLLNKALLPGGLRLRLFGLLFFLDLLLLFDIVLFFGVVFSIPITNAIIG